MTTICPECDARINEDSRFCPSCGCSLLISENRNIRNRFSELKDKMKKIGDKTSVVGKRAKGVISQERTTETAKNLLSMMTKVAREVRKDLPVDMVKAIDLRASVSLIALSIGVTIDLEKLQVKRMDID